MFSKLDLHSHTTASDGVFTPQALVATALQRRLRVLAITDHESTEGIAEALIAARGTALQVWPGVEISTDVPLTEVHILGYLMDIHDPQFQSTLCRLRESRLDRAQRMVAKLGELGLPVSWQRVQEIAGEGSVGRPHVAQAMVEQGHVPDITAAFNLYIGRNGPAYVERFRLAPEDAVRAIVAVGGLAVLAHPVIADAGNVQRLDLDALLPGLCAAGLGGLEVYYPRYTPAITAELLRVARRWNLVATGGSDFHGRGTLTIGVGEIAIPEQVIEKVRQRHEEQLRASRDSHGDRSS